jgi:hypothetical protein
VTPEELEQARGVFDRLVNDVIYEYHHDHHRWPTEVRIPWPEYQDIMNRDHWNVMVPKDSTICATISALTSNDMLSGAISTADIISIPLYRNTKVRRIMATTYIPPAHNMAFPF